MTTPRLKHTELQTSIPEVPQAVETERKALAFVLADPKRAGERLELLPDALFADLRCLSIRHAMGRCLAADKDISSPSVSQLLPRDEALPPLAVFLSDLEAMDLSGSRFEHVVAALQNVEAKRSDAEDTFQRLAMLDGVAYDRVRKQEASRLGVRPATLDAEVGKRRPGACAPRCSSALVPEAQPWPSPVDGAEVLNQVAETLSTYIALPKGAANAIALWIAHTHCFRSFSHTPRLNIRSAVKGSGKSTLRAVIGEMVARPVPAENLSVAVMFRVVEAHSPTLLLDEADAWLRDSEELRGVLNSGHLRGGQVIRCVGDDHELTPFRTFCPVVLAGIGSLPGTLHDRSIVIELSRALPGELRRRFDSRHTKAESELGRKLARFASDNASRLEMLDPEIPEGAFNRTADNWRPLFAIAQVAGGDWPARVEASFQALNSSDTEDHGTDVMLLEDIREAFNAKERMFTRDLLKALHSMADRPWNEQGKGGRPISENWLGRALRKFKVKSGTLRISGERAKGYERVDLEDVFARYLPQPGLSTRDTVTNQAGVGEIDFSTRDTETGCHGSETQEVPVNIDLSRCHGSIPPEGAKSDAVTTIELDL